jgi:hypothetical protein
LHKEIIEDRNLTKMINKRGGKEGMNEGKDNNMI